ncbi:MAG: hypothetical protein E6R13_01670 [Spirochaetes bacterium]|nr:MAG: hypothetical protein E6R13_01670 [Spirochaetota bacterium]
MKIYKLKYTDKETAIADLIKKGVYIETNEGLEYGTGIHSVVELGLIALVEGDLDTAPVYADGYHVDVMARKEIEFENEIQVNNPKHTFFGH